MRFLWQSQNPVWVQIDMRQKMLQNESICSLDYECPKERAAMVALESVKNYLESNPLSSIKRVAFVLFSQDDYDLFESLLKVMGN